MPLWAVPIHRAISVLPTNLLEWTMKARCPRTKPTLAALAVAALAVTTLPTLADARSMSFVDAQSVNVQVGFSTQMPLADDNEQTLMSAQRSGRRTLYEMASKECTLLMATIAKTCHLTNLNVSAQVRQRNNSPTMLMLNGNARFAITLKEGQSD
jgi:hypothetical protein